MVAQHGFGALLSGLCISVTAYFIRMSWVHLLASLGGSTSLALLGQALPWTPLALAGAWRSLERLIPRREGLPCTVVGPVFPDNSTELVTVYFGSGRLSRGFARTGTCQERPLCHFGSGAMVDLGRAGDC